MKALRRRTIAPLTALCFSAVFILLTGGAPLLVSQEEPPADDVLEVEEDEVVLASQGYRRRDGRPLLSQQLPEDSAVVLAASQEECWRLYALVRQCGLQCRQFLGIARSGAPLRVLHFQLVDGAEDPAAADVASRGLVLLERTWPPQSIVRTICREMVRRRLRQSCRVRRGAPVGAIYDFLGAALARRAMADSDARAVSRMEEYTPLRRAFDRGAFPDVRQMLETPVPLNAPSALYNLYLLHCEVLLSALEANRDIGDAGQFAEAWMASANADGCETASDALEALLGIGHSPGALQRWYESHADAVVRNSLGALDFAECRQQLEQLLSVPVLDASASSGIRVIPLRQLPELLPDYRLDGAAVGRMQDRLTQLMARAPLVVREALEGFQTALDKMVRQDYRGFRKDYDLALEKLREGEARWTKALKLLEEGSAAPDDRQRALAEWLRLLEFQEELRRPVDRLLEPEGAAQ